MITTRRRVSAFEKWPDVYGKAGVNLGKDDEGMTITPYISSIPVLGGNLII